MKGFILAMVLVVVFAGDAAAQQPTMEDIVKKWDARRAGIKTVRYTFTEHTTVKRQVPGAGPGQTNGVAYPRSEYKLVSAHRLLVDLPTGRFRHEIDGQEWDLKAGRVVASRGVTVFNGERMKSLRWPNAEESDVGKQPGLGADFAEITGDFRGQAFQVHIHPVFYDFGIVPLLIGETLHPGQFHKYNPADFADTTTTVAQLNPNGLSTFSLSPLVRRRINPSGRLTVRTSDGAIRELRTSISGIETTTQVRYRNRDGQWPQLLSWVTELDASGSVTNRSACDDLRIEEDVRLSPDAFDLSPKSGMILMKIDQPNDGSSRSAAPVIERYTVDDDGSLRRLSAAKNSRGVTYRTLLSAAAILVIVLVGGWLAFRRRRKGPPPSPAVA